MIYICVVRSIMCLIFGSVMDSISRFAFVIVGSFMVLWAYSLPAWIIKIPITFLEVVAWVFITYYVIGFDPSAGR